MPRLFFSPRILRQKGGPFDLKASQVWLGVVSDSNGYNGITVPQPVHEICMSLYGGLE